MPSLKPASLFVMVSTLAAVGAGCGPEAADLSVLAPQMVVTPARLDDRVFIGQTRRVRLTVENPGAAAAGDLTAHVEDAQGPAAVMVEIVGDGTLGAQDTVELELRLSGLGPEPGLMLGALALSTPDGGSLEVPLAISVQNPPSCDTGNPCTAGTFDFATGACVFTPVADGQPCDDDNICTLNTVCSAGQCVGDMMACDDGVACTQDFCDPEVGCASEPVNTRCDDEDPCTDDVCVADVGCENTTSDDGTLCHQDGCASIGLCLSGTCEVTTSTNGLPCDDGDTCTDGETCQAGVCGGGEETGVGSGLPVILVGQPQATDLCLGSYDFCELGEVMAQPAEVIATFRDGDLIATVWRTDFLNTLTGAPCQPWPEQVANTTILRDGDLQPGFGGAGQESPVPPPSGEGAEADRAVSDAPDEDSGAALPPVDACAAGVFLTTHLMAGDIAPGFGAPMTVQLGSTRGPAAGDFRQLDDQVWLAVASVPDDRLAVQDIVITGAGEFTLAGQEFRSVYEQQTNPLRALAIGRGQGEEKVVVGTRAIRQSSVCTALCDDPNGCCDTTADLWQLGVDNFDPSVLQEQLVLPEVISEDCPITVDTLGVGTGFALTVRDLQVSLGGASQITLLMKLSPCDDPVQATSGGLYTPVRFERPGAGASWLPQSPAFYEPNDSEAGIVGVRRLHTVPASSTVAGVVDFAGCADIGGPPMFPGEEQPVPAECVPVAATATHGGAVGPQLSSWGYLSGNALDADALPVPVEGDNYFMLTRSGGLLDLRVAEAGVVTQTPLNVVGDWEWNVDLRAGKNLVAGISRFSSNVTDTPCDCLEIVDENGDPVPGDCGCGEDFMEPYRSVTVVPVGCAVSDVPSTPFQP